MVQFLGCQFFQTEGVKFGRVKLGVVVYFLVGKGSKGVFGPIFGVSIFFDGWGKI